MRVVTAEEMRAAERRAENRGISIPDMIRQAGIAVAREAMSVVPEGPIVVVVGPGNNGSDGLAAARYLSDSGRFVRVFALHRRSDDPYLGPVALLSDDMSGLDQALSSAACVIDALLGTGQTRAPEGLLARTIESINQSRDDRFVLSVDIPTGVNADTGQVPGPAVRADVTLAMGAAKIGLFQYPGAEYAGRVEVSDAGVGDESFQVSRTEAMTIGDAATLIPNRNANGSKGSSGSVLFVGGSRDFCGAPVMASMGAYRSGAGLVQIAVPGSIKNVVASHAVEPVFLPLPEQDGAIDRSSTSVLAGALQKARSCVAGCGMSQTESTFAFTERFLGLLRDSQTQCVLDADFLNNMSKLDHWWGDPPAAVITPHPGEMSRLTGLEIGAIQADRVRIAREHAHMWKVVVVLKGAGTVVASPDGRVSINTTGGPNLATAGTGDVLSGVIAGLLAQGCSLFDAARLGVYLHGLAGDLVRAEYGDAGTIAGDLLPRLPQARVRVTSALKEHM